VGLAPKSWKFTVTQVIWDKDPKTESGFGSKIRIMQTHCKPGGLQDLDVKTELGFGPKIMHTHCKPGGLKHLDLKTEPGFDLDRSHRSKVISFNDPNLFG